MQTALGKLSWVSVGRERQVRDLDATGAPTSTGVPAISVDERFEGTELTKYHLKIVTTGTETTAEYQYSDDDGSTWSANITASTTWTEMSKGIGVLFGAGNYVITEVWTVDVYPWGTKVTPTDSFGMLVGESVKRESPPIFSALLRRDQQRHLPAIGGVISNGGTIPTEFQTEGAFGLILYQLLGGYTYEELNASPLVSKHTFYPSPEANGFRLPEGLTFRMCKGGTATWDNFGSYINTLNFKQDINAILMADIEIMGKDADAADGEVGTPSYADYDVLSFAYANLDIDGVYQEVSNLNYTINHNLSGDKRALGTRSRVFIPAGGLDVTGSFNVEFDNLDLYNAYIGIVPASLVATFIGSLITGVFYKKLTITTPKVVYTGDTPTVNNESVLTYDMPFEAKKDDDLDLDSITIELINTDAAYI